MLAINFNLNSLKVEHNVILSLMETIFIYFIF